MKATYSVIVDRVAGTLTVDIPTFNPMVVIKAPIGSTHFKLVSGAAELDFTNEASVKDSQESGYVAVGSNSLSALSLVNQVSPNSTLPLVTVLGIQFFQEVNSVFYAMNSGAFNSLLVADVNV